MNETDRCVAMLSVEHINVCRDLKEIDALHLA